MTILIGQDLGGYRIISQVGKGGMATVYKAFQPSLDRYVAIKVMPPFYAQEDDTFIKRFKREAQSIAKLRHPNILLVIDFGEQDGLIYIVMEFVDAGTLTDRLGKPLPFADAAKILDQVASALDYAHTQGLVHRDVKPSNILLPKPDWPLLTDFGLAKIVGGSHLTITGTIAGTPAYMSPEQGQGESVDARSDIYSLGIVLYEMMTGCVPYQAETPMAVVVKHIIEPLPLPSTRNANLPENVESVILKALAKNPDDRYQRATALAQAFRDAIETMIPKVVETPTVLSTEKEDADVATVVETEMEGLEADSEVLERGGSEAEVLIEDQEIVTPSRVVDSLPVGEQPSQTAQVTSGVAIPAPAQKSLQSLLERLPWLKWLIPAGGAAAALCVIGLAIAFLIVPNLKDHPGTQTPIAATLTAEEHFVQGNDLFNAHEYDAAILDYQAAIDQGLEDTSVYFSLAEALNETGRVEEAIGTIDRVVRLSPENPSVHEAAAWFYQGIGYHYQAINHFENALRLNPDGTHFLEALAESYTAVGEYQRAAEILGEGQVSGNENDASRYEEQGWEHLASWNLPEAEEAFHQAIDLNPDLEGAWEGLAEVYWNQGQLELAINTLNDAIKIQEDYAPFHEKLGWLYLELGDHSRAEEAFNKALFLDSTSDSAWDGLSEVYLEQNKLDLAINVMETAIESNPDHDSLYEKAGYLYWLGGDQDRAIQRLDEAINLAPGTTYAYITLSDLWNESGDDAKALDVLERGLAENPERAELHESIGYLFFDWGQYEDAIASFNQSIRLDPENGWTYLSLAYAYQAAGLWDDANEALWNAEQNSYDDPWFLEAIGWSYIDMGNCERALQLFEKVLTIDPTNEGAPEGIASCSG